MRGWPLALPLIVAMALPAPAASLLKVSFSYRPAGPAKSVALVGSFNNWDQSAQPMRRTGARWTTTLELAPGTYAYKFVIDGATYVTDPAAPATAEDGFGGKNGILVLEAPRGALKPPGELEPTMLRHRAAMPDRDRLDEKTVSLRLVTRPGDATSIGLLELRSNLWTRREMTRFARTAQGDYYRVKLEPEGGPLRYAFWIDDAKGSHFLGPDGVSRKPGKPYVWNWRATPPFTVPGWARGAVFYQIFPERFANGDPRNDPPGTVAWGAPPSNWNFTGGDLVGVQRHLDYLSDLGIDGIYFNPVFEAPSNHRYDTTDYTRIDPHLGSNLEFQRLSTALHARGIQVLLDGVFNHTGTQFAAFQEALARGPASPAFGWYSFDGFPVVQAPKPNYRCWWGFASLPQLNHANPEVRDYLLGVGQRWLGPGLADGWRLDVPNEVPRSFWSAFRAAVREVRPDALTVGEIWTDASPWLRGDAFDSVMNYRFRSALLDFFAYDKTDSRQLGEALDQIRADYPDQVEPVLFNLLDSHDTPRFLHEAHEDKDRLRLASFLQFTYPGMPALYYGDEVGLTGGADPDNRRCMIWDPTRQDLSLLGHYQRLSRMRHAHPALRAGDYERLDTGAARVFAFRRRHPEEQLLVIINAGKTPFPLAKIQATGATWLYPSGDGQEVPPMTGAVLVEGDSTQESTPLKGDQPPHPQGP